MKAINLETSKWFTRIGPDKRVYKRLAGPAEEIDGTLGVPVQPITPTIRETGFFIPADEEVKEYKLNFVRVN